MGADQVERGVQESGVAVAASVADAHKALLADKTLQFDIAHAKPPEPPDLPAWLEPVGQVLAAIGPVLGIVFWCVVAAGVLLIIALIVREALTIRFGGPKAAARAKDEIVDWRPSAEQARVLLADVDALADRGLYAEAAHQLLLRGVQDIRDHRPGLVRPALTSRDIAGLTELSEAARRAFGSIAAIVERSLFGGREVGRDDWAACRSAYEGFALGTPAV